MWGNFVTAAFFLFPFSLLYHYFSLHPYQVAHVNNRVSTLMYFFTYLCNAIEDSMYILDLEVSVWQKWVYCMHCSLSCFSHSKRHGKSMYITLYNSIIFPVVSYCFPNTDLLMLQLFLYTMWEMDPTFSPRLVVNYTNTVYWVVW